jgi:hypothetical protein
VLRSSPIAPLAFSAAVLSSLSVMQPCLAATDAQLAPASSGTEQATPQTVSDDKVSFTASSISLGPGYVWGHGILHYRGVDYAITVSGGGAPGVGYSHLCAEGTITGLNSVDNFDSTFWAVSAEATAGQGSGVMALQNARGAEMHLDTSASGVRLAAEASRLRFRLTGPAKKPISSFSCKTQQHKA